jgi:hypothetical protein
MLQRTVSAEILDSLPPDDPQAVRARRDLRRIHRVMGTRRIVQEALDNMLELPRRLVTLRMLELGAGDGTLMLDVARTLSTRGTPVELTLLDCQALVSRATIAAYAEVGWTAVPHTVDVFDWVRTVSALSPAQGPHWDLIVANLFLHHFSAAQLDQLMTAIAYRATLLFACEPRRSWLALAASHLVGLIGSNAVTRVDAVLSVRAGFRNQELTAAWPERTGNWRLTEYPAGMFSHCIRAERKGHAP